MIDSSPKKQIWNLDEDVHLRSAETNTQLVRLIMHAAVKKVGIQKLNATVLSQNR